MARVLLRWTIALLCAAAPSATLAANHQKPSDHKPMIKRSSVIPRAKVWTPTNVAAKDIRSGPRKEDAFEPGETVYCTYSDKKLSGASPKFACRLEGGDEVKVKFGGTNGEVYAEVAATRLLWALGFGADRMYPVRVVCHECPSSLNGIQKADGDSLMAPAAIERKHAGTEITDGGQGWSWDELKEIDERAGGATKAERDALKLLAVFLQHSDNKPRQQRLVCLDSPPKTTECDHPFMLINDLGITFGKATLTNANLTGSANLKDWASTPVWKGETGCIGNLRQSMTGTLWDPVISEEGRQFLANLLVQLSDKQLYDLFDIARFDLRPRSPKDGASGFPSTDEWVNTFKQKRGQIVDRRCS